MQSLFHYIFLCAAGLALSGANRNGGIRHFGRREGRSERQGISTRQGASGLNSTTVAAIETNAVKPSGLDAAKESLMESSSSSSSVVRQWVNKVEKHVTDWTPVVRQLFAGVTFVAAIKAGCMLGNILYTVSPFQEVQVWGDCGTGNADAAPYVSMAFGGWQWCAYGLAAFLITKNEGFLILVYANCLGAVLGIYYSLKFHWYCRNNDMASNLRQYMVAVSFILFSEVFMWLTLAHQRALLAHSFIASCVSFMGAMSILTVLPTVLSTQDTSAICGPLVGANLLGGSMWVYYGCLMGDYAIVVPNACAATTSSLCLALKLLYRPMGKANAGGAKLGTSWQAAPWKAKIPPP